MEKRKQLLKLSNENKHIFILIEILNTTESQKKMVIQIILYQKFKKSRTPRFFPLFQRFSQTIFIPFFIILSMKGFFEYLVVSQSSINISKNKKSFDFFSKTFPTGPEKFLYKTSINLSYYPKWKC